jgi:hypothetical protein
MLPTDIAQIIAQSSATPAFKADARAYAEHRAAPRIDVLRHSPRIKVLRVLAQLLANEPQLAVDGVQVDAASGCSDFRGTLVVRADDRDRTFDFVWDCQWRAMQEGWADAFGLPDQIRAARTFDWRCFAHWSERATAEQPAAAVG